MLPDWLFMILMFMGHVPPMRAAEMLLARQDERARRAALANGGRK
jgi:hypothetical protein